MLEVKGLNEECGVFGVSNNKDAMYLTYYGLHALQHRGQEAGGIAFVDSGKLKVIRNSGLVTEIFEGVEFNKIKTNTAIGHVRYATSGNLGLVNVQPFYFEFHDEQVALAHNGHIGNSKILKEELEKKGSVFASTSDSEIIMHLLRHSSGKFIDRLTSSLRALEGAFAYLLIRDSILYGIRDKYGLRPLSLGMLEDGSYVLTSETCAFNVTGAKFIRDIEPGEIVKIENNEVTSYFYTDESSHNMCLMEYVYFSRPDSCLDGTNVHYARKRSGEVLAKESHVDADIVIGVPDSSISAAMGYASESKIPYEIGLIKNRYVGRTFIQPTQELRDRGVKMKLSAVREIVEGMRVVLIDDSIVRGTTSKRIIKLLKDAGAKEVHVRIASPPIKYPCYYGVDISTFEELVSNRLNVQELCEYISADSLYFLSLEGLEESILYTKYNKVTTEKRYCSACFNGKYVTDLYEDIEELNKGD